MVILASLKCIDCSQLLRYSQVRQIYSLEGMLKPLCRHCYKVRQGQDRKGHAEAICANIHERENNA